MLCFVLFASLLLWLRSTSKRLICLVSTTSRCKTLYFFWSKCNYNRTEKICYPYGNYLCKPRILYFIILFGWSLWNQRQGVWSLNDHTRFYSTLSKLITTKIIYIQLEFAINESYFLANWTVPGHKMYCCRPTIRYWGIYCRMKTIPNLCYNS